ncbi:TAXI family TRAP transporter solute-binding subunit [Ammoniphilus resinae]|uniref:TRAP transporter TAXI family solute receptor n=1 Tax=Ammoniphilus resinae TaxID=861532 RepID=A0ABS4GUD2_9BACL|nr:TAXI family TRAP transporter solute-binding subunit [Ammoniphilus resinae]MBP1933874.1 TRAP transporter TAXI family solute receptor [Ammoniphilus resinae]
MKKLSGVILATILTFSAALVGCGSQPAEQTSAQQPAAQQEKKEEKKEENKDFPKFVKIAGATSGGTYFLMANAMSQLLNEKIPGINATAQSTAGSPKILELLDTNGGELGVAQAGVADEAFNGKGQFEGKAMKNISQVAFMYPNVMQLVVRKDAGIKTPADLKGKAVAVGAVGSATEINSKDLFVGAGFNYPDDITPEYTSESQSADLLKNKQVVAGNMIASLGSSAMLDIMSTGEFEVLPIPEDMIKKLHDEVNVAYFPYEIPANTYPNQTEPIKTYAVANWLHARADVSEDFIYEVVKQLYENHDYLVNAHKVMENMTLETALNGQTIPLHPGAVKYFKEQGIEVKQ